MAEISAPAPAFWNPEDRATRRSVLISLLLLTWALGLLLLDAKSLWLDEAYGLYVTRLGLPMLWAGQSEPYHPPLFYWLLERWLRLGGGEFLWRFPSVCFTVLSALAAYRLACAWFGRAVALTAAALTALSPVLIWYAQELRPYALLVLLSLVTTGAVTRLCLRPGPIPFLIAAGAVAAAIYLHYFALLLLGVHLITFVALLAARRTTPWALPWVAGAWAVAFAAWWPWVQSPAFAAFARLLTDSGNYVAVLLTQRLHVPPALLGAAPIWLGLGAAAGLALLALLYRLLRLMRERGASARLRRSRVLPYAAAALFALLLVYFVVPRAYTAKRQLLLLVPYLLIAFAWCWPWGKDRRLLGTVAALSLALALVNVVLVPKNQWREAAAYIAAHAQPDDLVLLTPRYMTAPYDLYAPADLPREGLPFAFDEAALRALETGHERIWVVFDPFDADPAGHLQQWLSEHGELADTATFYRLEVELYEMGR